MVSSSFQVFVLFIRDFVVVFIPEGFGGVVHDVADCFDVILVIAEFEQVEEGVGNFVGEEGGAEFFLVEVHGADQDWEGVFCVDDEGAPEANFAHGGIHFLLVGVDIDFDVVPVHGQVEVNHLTFRRKSLNFVQRSSWLLWKAFSRAGAMK